MKKDKYQDPYSVQILPTKILKSELQDSISFSKDIYFSCSCQDLGHMGRISFYVEANKGLEEEPLRVIMDDVSFEFNGTNWGAPSYTYEFKNRRDKILFPFFKIYNRIRGAIRMLLGLPVYFSTNTLLTVEGAKDLAVSILEAINQLESEAHLCLNQKRSKK